MESMENSHFLISFALCCTIAVLMIIYLNFFSKISADHYAIIAKMLNQSLPKTNKIIQKYKGKELRGYHFYFIKHNYDKEMSLKN